MLSVFVEQVTTVTQAREAPEAGVDVIIAQGGEGGGFSGSIGTLALVPQVVDAVAPIPVVAAGGIMDGRGLGAAIALGAQGVNMGTRFLASVECRIPESWKQAIVAAESENAVKVEPQSTSLLPSPKAAGRRFRARFEPRLWMSGPRAETKCRPQHADELPGKQGRRALLRPLRSHRRSTPAQKRCGRVA
jgi:NAD(P)H-dependent flavin oxidoreductase YrpB (nitropropane dioxygenase family)